MDRIYHPLSPNYVRCERVAGLIFLSIVATALLIGWLVLLVLSWPPGIWVFIAAVAGFVGWALIAWFTLKYPTWDYERRRWCLDERSLEIQSGIWWRSVVTIPRARVQHVDVSQGPLARRYDLATLVVHTAGTEHSKIELDGLPHPAAQQLRDAIIGGTQIQSPSS